MTVLLGVDPGQTGALATLTGTGDLLSVDNMPDPLHGGAIGDLINGEGITFAAIEQVHAMPRQGVSSSFKFGWNTAIVVGAIGHARIPYRFVTPTVWKKAMRVTKDKATSRERATELWPNHANLFHRSKDGDRAEAALIAYWLYEQNRKAGGMSTEERDHAIREELDWLNREASVQELTLDGFSLTFEKALRLYAPTLYELWRPRP